jgi:hypothetical protein
MLFSTDRKAKGWFLLINRNDGLTKINFLLMKIRFVKIP